jgi:hypothetical protein
MKQKLLDCVVFSRQLPFTQDCMHKFVASPAEHRQSACQFGFVEVTANLAFSVPGSRDQMMPRQLRLVSLAKFTGTLTHQH